MTLTITTGIMGDSLGDMTGYDHQASAERYSGLLIDALKAAYPDADVTINIDLSIVGAEPFDMQTRVEDEDGMSVDDEWPRVRDIIQRVYDDAQWPVEAA